MTAARTRTRALCILGYGLATLLAVLAPGRADALVVDRISPVVRHHLGEVRVCYVHALAHRPTLAGRVTVGFDVDPSGVVVNARVTEDTVGDPGMSECILGAVRSWTFAPVNPSVGVEAASYPFVFER